MGFSAGGYVAAKAGLQYTAETRPNFVAPIYACCMNMAEEKVPEDAPPMFLLHAHNDPVSTSSPSIYLAWKAAKRPAELHSYGAGGHGFGRSVNSSMPTNQPAFLQPQKRPRPPCGRPSSAPHADDLRLNWARTSPWSAAYGAQGPLASRCPVAASFSALYTDRERAVGFTRCNSYSFRPTSGNHMR